MTNIKPYIILAESDINFEILVFLIVDMLKYCTVARNLYFPN